LFNPNKSAVNDSGHAHTKLVTTLSRIPLGYSFVLQPKDFLRAFMVWELLR